MIEKIYGEFYIRCDACEELSDESFDTFQDAEDGHKKIGWGISLRWAKFTEGKPEGMLQCSGGVIDVCPECQEDENI